MRAQHPPLWIDDGKARMPGGGIGQQARRRMQRRARRNRVDRPGHHLRNTGERERIDPALAHQVMSAPAARDAGLTPSQHQALLAIKGVPAGQAMTIGDLAERLCIRHNSAVELVDRLALLAWWSAPLTRATTDG
jgi:hypothetical protein